MAQQHYGQVPDFFQHPAYEAANRYVLSTSTLSTDTVILGGFGPVVPDGYGIGYNAGSQRLGCVVSAYKDARDAAEFVRALEESLDDIKSIVE